MAYMSQENKKSKAPAVKAILKKYGVKGSLSVRNHSTLVLNIKSGGIDFMDNYNTIMAYRDLDSSRPFQPVNYIDVNPYHYEKQFNGKALEFVREVFSAMNTGNHDNSDIMTDYFDVGFYVDIHIGQWDKAYELVK